MVIFLWVMVLLIPGRAWSQVEISSLGITNIETSKFPLIELQVLAKDASGQPLQELPESMLTVWENDAEQELASVETVEAGIRIAWVIDPGDGAFNTGVTLSEVSAEALSDLRVFVQERPWMVPGVDEVIVLTQEGPDTKVLLRASGEPEALLSVAESYVPPNEAVAELPDYGDHTRRALLSALKELRYARQQVVDRAEAILLYTPGMRADLTDVAEQAIALGIPIHIMLTRRQPTDYWADALRPLARVTGGEFIARYERGDPEPLFEFLASQRLQHRVAYETSLTTAEERTVTLQAAWSEGSIVTSSTYSVDLAPPQVEIIAPMTERIFREAQGTGETGLDAEPAFINVIAEVSWPDGMPRPVEAARLLVDGVAVGQSQVAGNQAELRWDIRGYQSESWTPVTLQVEMVDTFGMHGKSDTHELVIQYVPAQEKSLNLPENVLIYASGGIALVSLGMALFLFFNRAQVSSALQEAREGVVDFVERVTGRRTALVARGYLVPLEGFEEPPAKSYEIYGTTAIGRSRRHADLLFHIGEENSPISRLHCTLLDEDDHFTIRDEDSSNGTFVNSEKLTPLQPIVLHDGDILEIAPLERGGLRLMFQMARLDGEMPDPDDTARITRPRQREERTPEV
jgi:hypothetical protein